MLLKHELVPRGFEHCPDDPTVKTVWNVYEVAPPILESTGKIKNPWPNVDAHSGATGDVMTSTYFRDNMPADKKLIYEQRLMDAMEYLEPMSRDVDTAKCWSGPSTGP